MQCFCQQYHAIRCSDFKHAIETKHSRFLAIHNQAILISARGHSSRSLQNDDYVGTQGVLLSVENSYSISKDQVEPELQEL